LEKELFVRQNNSKASNPVFVQNCLLTGEVNFDMQRNFPQDKAGG
jgi:hypothetical protein